MQEPRANQEGTRREPRGKKPRENQEQTKRETKGKPEDSQRKAKDTTAGDHRAQVPPPMIDDKRSQTSKQTRDPRETYGILGKPTGSYGI